MTMALVQFDAEVPTSGGASYDSGYSHGYEMGRKLGIITGRIYSEHSDMTIYRPVLKSPSDPANSLVLYSDNPRSKADLDSILQKACDGIFKYDIVEMSQSI